MRLTPFLRRFNNLSFRKKLVALTTATSGLAILLASLSFAILESFIARSALQQDVELTAELIGANSAAALLFNDQTAASENLGVLSSRGSILSAALYDISGVPFATYKQVQAPAGSIQKEHGAEGATFSFESLRVVQPVVFQEKRIGWIVITSNLDALYLRLASIAGLMLVGFAFITFVAYKVSSRFQYLVADPIMQLADAARRVTVDGDYSLRVERLGKDEVGDLADRFNEMLQGIRERDAALQREIAIRTRAQDELHEFAARLERSNRELQDFASIASHDLQEPLRKVQAFADRLRSSLGYSMDERSADYMERMLNAIRRMQSLINDLLTYSRVTTKALPFARVNLAEIVAQVLGDLEVRIEQTGASIDVAALPEIDADATQMRQLFQNLIGNALKFTRPEVAPVLRIQHALETRAGDARTASVAKITISDNGIGFDEKYAEQIFVIFQRLHGRMEYEGTGIGLAVCKKIVDRHGGSISASSAPGEGATFVIHLPLTRGEA